MHPSRTLYWVYAITKKLFGNQVSIQRDRLHKMYQVNKYSVYLSPRDNIKLADIERELEKVFIRAGFDKDGFSYIKKWEKNKTIIHLLRYENRLNVVIFSYGL